MELRRERKEDIPGVRGGERLRRAPQRVSAVLKVVRVGVLGEIPREDLNRIFISFPGHCLH